MGREVHAPSHRVLYTRATARNTPDKKFCLWLLSVGHARISATKVIKCFAHPLLGLIPGAPSRLSCPNADTLVAPGGTHLIDCINFPLVHPLPWLPMSNPPARSLVRLVRASLRLVNDSTESLTTSQLLAIQHELRGALAAVCRKIKDNDNQRPSGKFFWNVQHG